MLSRESKVPKRSFIRVLETTILRALDPVSENHELQLGGSLCCSICFSHSETWLLRECFRNLPVVVRHSSEERLEHIRNLLTKQEQFLMRANGGLYHIARLPCGHIYCSDCLADCMILTYQVDPDRENTCPACDAPIKVLGDFEVSDYGDLAFWRNKSDAFRKVIRSFVWVPLKHRDAAEKAELILRRGAHEKLWDFNSIDDWRRLIPSELSDEEDWAMLGRSPDTRASARERWHIVFYKPRHRPLKQPTAIAQAASSDPRHPSPLVSEASHADSPESKFRNDFHGALQNLCRASRARTTAPNHNAPPKGEETAPMKRRGFVPREDSPPPKKQKTSVPRPAQASYGGSARSNQPSVSPITLKGDAKLRCSSAPEKPSETRADAFESRLPKSAESVTKLANTSDPGIEKQKQGPSIGGQDTTQAARERHTSEIQARSARLRTIIFNRYSKQIGSPSSTLDLKKDKNKDKENGKTQADKQSLGEKHGDDSMQERHPAEEAAHILLSLASTPPGPETFDQTPSKQQRRRELRPKTKTWIHA